MDEQKRMTEEELIAYAKPYLKARGFLKKNKRWTKTIGEFTLEFFIQGSCWDKEDYYIRPGIYVHGMDINCSYGHFHSEIEQTAPEQVLREFENFCQEWTDKALIKRRVLDFIEWEKRNPLEKRREENVDYKVDPPPSCVCFSIPFKVREYILQNF